MAIENLNHFNSENFNESEKEIGQEPEIKYQQEKSPYPTYIESLFEKKENIEDRIKELEQKDFLSEEEERELENLTKEREEIKKKIEIELKSLVENMPIDYNNKDIN